MLSSLKWNRKTLGTDRSAGLTVDGREVPHTLAAQILREADGVFGALVSARDMEKLSRLGSHLSYSQKLAALGRLTSGVAHEIKNPLNAMVIYVALLRQKLADAGLKKSDVRGVVCRNRDVFAAIRAPRHG